MFLLMWLGVAVGNRFLCLIGQALLTVPRFVLVGLASCESRLWEMVLLTHYLHQFPPAVVAKLAVLGIAQYLYPIPRTVSVVLLGSVGYANLSNLAVAVILADTANPPVTESPADAVLLDFLSVIHAKVTSNQYHFQPLLTNEIAIPANLRMVVLQGNDHIAKSTATFPHRFWDWGIAS